jgi:hypothetical protein
VSNLAWWEEYCARCTKPALEPLQNVVTGYSEDWELAYILRVCKGCQIIIGLEKLVDANARSR